MSLPRIVCPHNQELLRGMERQTVAVRVGHWEQAAAAAYDVRDAGHELFCVIADSPVPLQDVFLPADWKEIPLAIMAPSMGTFRNLAAKLDSWRDFNLCIYLPAAIAADQTSLRILSSLGIRTCALLGTGNNDWESLADLMTYAVLGQSRHARIEPFSYIADHYAPDANLDWGAVYFDDPRQFLHLDETGRVALSRAELEKGEFVAQRLAEIGVAADFPAIQKRTRSWTEYFLNNHPCSVCAGWKVCQGRFSASLPVSNGCSAFFREMIDVARQSRQLKQAREEKQAWLP